MPDENDYSVENTAPYSIAFFVGGNKLIAWPCLHLNTRPPIASSQQLTVLMTAECFQRKGRQNTRTEIPLLAYQRVPVPLCVAFPCENLPILPPLSLLHGSSLWLLNGNWGLSGASLITIHDEIARMRCRGLQGYFGAGYPSPLPVNLIPRFGNPEETRDCSITKKGVAGPIINGVRLAMVL